MFGTGAAELCIGNLLEILPETSLEYHRDLILTLPTPFSPAFPVPILLQRTSFDYGDRQLYEKVTVHSSPLSLPPFSLLRIQARVNT
ncbi:unnamed protein product [Allacma fusca]|uniref:Uncharacterized protein n=1 Tax=Allacma fusca TaxID=39272 RepID=A0A8J2Q5Z2_9HEXA|nr:unnamed protein product [Allacma fusca]